MSEPYMYDDDEELYAPEYDPAPAPSLEDIAAVTAAAVEQRVAQHEQSTAAQMAEFSIIAGEDDLRSRFADYDRVRDRAWEMFAKAGHSPYDFTSPAAVSGTLEFYARRAADELKEANRFKPDEEWAKVREAYTPNPWTSS